MLEEGEVKAKVEIKNYTGMAETDRMGDYWESRSSLHVESKEYKFWNPAKHRKYCKIWWGLVLVFRIHSTKS